MKGNEKGARRKAKEEGEGISKLTAGAKCYAKPNKGGNKREK